MAWLAAIAWAPPARADAVCGDGGPAVVLRAPRIGDAFAEEIADHLRRSLAQRGIAVCVGGDARGIAALDIAPGADAFSLTVDVEDDVTHKRIVRDLDVRTIPEEGRPLAVAQAADELLRASWAELFVEGSPVTLASAPPAVVEAGRPRIGPQAEPRSEEGSTRFELGAGIGGELFTSGHAQIGPQIVLGWYPLGWAGAVARGGLRAGAERDTRFGSLETSAMTGSFGVVARSRVGAKVGLEVGPHLHAMRFAFVGSPAPGFVARDAAAVGLYGALEGRLWLVPVAPLFTSLGLSLGAPVRSARVIGPDATVHEIGGLLVGANLHVGAGW